MKTHLYLLAFAILSLLTACQNDPLAYRKGKPQNLADRIEQFATALDTKFDTEGISKEEASQYTETFKQYASEAKACYGELTIDDTQRIVAALGRISGVILKSSSKGLINLIRGGAKMLPGFLNELNSSISDSEDILELEEFQEMLKQKLEEL